jgi:gamma-glutamyltranspeptidase/glutathione hydrolase
MDAAIATAFAQGVTNPLLCGLGGTGIMLCYNAEQRKTITLDFSAVLGSVPVPKEWEKEYVGRAETVGRYILKSEANQVGYQSIMIPGFVKGCWVTYQRFGSRRLTWPELLAPSIQLAKNGFEVYPYIAGLWRMDAGKPGYPGLAVKMRATPDAARLYLKPGGSAYEEGELFAQPEMAQTLQRLADAGGDDFYTGEIGRAIADDLEKHRALIHHADVRDYAVVEQAPVRGSYRGLEVTSASVPGYGAHIVEMLQILEHFDLVKLGHNTPEYVDTFARVQRAAFADNVRLKCMGDEAHELESQIAAPARAAYWANRIKNGDRIVVRGGAVDSGTTHLTCVDADGNVVSITHSIGSLAGSGAITPGLGFLYNNFLGHYNPLAGHPDSIGPRKRIGSVLPTIIFRDAQPYIAIGAPGGSRIVTAMAQSVVNVIDHKMDMRTAVTAPRFHSEERQLLFLESPFPESTAQALSTMGNDVRRSAYMARVQAIRIREDTGELEAGPDPRGGAGVGQYPPQAVGAP